MRAPAAGLDLPHNGPRERIGSSLAVALVLVSWAQLVQHAEYDVSVLRMQCYDALQLGKNERSATRWRPGCGIAIS